MKYLLIITLLMSQLAFGQEPGIENISKSFHRMLVSNDSSLAGILDSNVSYGHSNGWVETKQDILRNLASGQMKYVDIKEDSFTASIDNDLAHIRFVALLTYALDGKETTIRLKVLEVWRKKKGNWLLYARQATRN
ncbi:MAG: nuclear transport factor 2 family protein [Bacteroidota bacterium]